VKLGCALLNSICEAQPSLFSVHIVLSDNCTLKVRYVFCSCATT